MSSEIVLASRYRISHHIPHLALLVWMYCDGKEVNAYVFPPFGLIHPLLGYLQSQRAIVTMVVPGKSPRPPWWPTTVSMSPKGVVLARNGALDVFLAPAKRRCEPTRLYFDLWAFWIDRFEYVGFPLQALPRVPRLFVPSVGCPQCAYPNYEGFRFCQSCGSRRAPFKESPISLKEPVNIQDIRRRKLELTCRRSATPYGKQKSALEKEFTVF